MKKIKIGLIILVAIILWVTLLGRAEIDYSNDPNNCGAADNLCDDGYGCFDAVCVLK